jgi:hypothetical protein
VTVPARRTHERFQRPHDASIFGDDWPSNPYDARPRRLLRTADGVIVHSIGRHRVEHLGSADDQKHLAASGLLIHLPDPAHRGRASHLPPS